MKNETMVDAKTAGRANSTHGKSARPEQTQSLPECSAYRFNVSARFADGGTTVSRLLASMPPGAALTNQAAKLDSLMTILYGPGIDTFHSMAASIQESMLSLIADLASEVHALAQLNEQHVDQLTRSIGESAHE